MDFQPPEHAFIPRAPSAPGAPPKAAPGAFSVLFLPKGINYPPGAARMSPHRVPCTLHVGLGGTGSWGKRNVRGGRNTYSTARHSKTCGCVPLFESVFGGEVPACPSTHPAPLPRAALFKTGSNISVLGGPPNIGSGMTFIDYASSLPGDVWPPQTGSHPYLRNAFPKKPLKLNQLGGDARHS